MIKSIWQILFSKKVFIPIAQIPVKDRSLGFCMIFAGCDSPSLGGSYFKIDVNADDLKKFEKLPEKISPIAFLFSYLSISNFNYKYSFILIHINNDELFIHMETTQDGKSEITYIDSPIKDINLAEYMSSKLVDFLKIKAISGAFFNNALFWFVNCSYCFGNLHLIYNFNLAGKDFIRTVHRANVLDSPGFFLWIFLGTVKIFS